MIGNQRNRGYQILNFSGKFFREPFSLNSREVAKFIPAPGLAPRITEHRRRQDNYYALVTLAIIDFKRLVRFLDLKRNRDDLVALFAEQKERLCRVTLLHRFVFQLDTPFRIEWQAYYFLKAFSVFWKECYARRVYAIITVFSAAIMFVF